MVPAVPLIATAAPPFITITQHDVAFAFTQPPNANGLTMDARLVQGRARFQDCSVRKYGVSSMDMGKRESSIRFALRLLSSANVQSSSFNADALHPHPLWRNTPNHVGNAQSIQDGRTAHHRSVATIKLSVKRD
ncbi:hypothetical protein J1614_004581 [Plenodomus biglobosus]|nr:hypothetical protein J1614_004581 [Plenodomus biglobosus]